MIALIILMSIAIPSIALPSYAATANTRSTYAFCGVIPNTTGVSQGVTIHVGILEQMDETTHWQEGWTGLTVTVTKPDNTTEMLGPFTTDTTGGTGITYVPEMAGTYYFQTHFPSQVCLYATMDTPANTTMLASDSTKTALTVTESPRQYYPGQPLPTEYWSRPIDSQLREWSSISGNWFQSGGYTSSSVADFESNAAPESAHILWSRQDLGSSGAGLVGGLSNDEHGYFTGDAYEGKFPGSVILAGVLFYNRYAGSVLGDAAFQTVVAVDLHTGKELWEQNWNNDSLSFGQILNWNTPNGHGAFSYLWSVVGSTWNAYDPLKGTWAFSLSNVPSGTRYYGPNGEILVYSVDTTNSRLLRWNSTWAVKYYDQYDPNNPFSAPITEYSWVSGFATHLGTTIDASYGYDLNVSIPTSLSGTMQAALPDRIIGSNVGGLLDAAFAPSTINLWALSLKAGQEGKVIFNANTATPQELLSGNQTIMWTGFSNDSMVGLLWSKEGRCFYGFSLETGNLSWGPSATQYYTDAYTTSVALHVAYGNIYESGVGGTVYCIDVKNGTQEWTYNNTDIYDEFKTTPNWWSVVEFVSDGKVYVGHVEHSANDPKPRGAPFVCLNATNGDVIWQIDGAFRQTPWGGAAMIGDSIITTMDTYDQQIYAIGKGPSQVTVQAPSVGVTTATPITISGTVIDVSPGTTQDAIKLRFPNGVPAVSDASQSDWMLCVYKQFAAPSNAIGVPLTISVVDANGNYREIGTTTSDAYGTYAFNWTPDIPGAYQVIVSFAGSNAYYPSSNTAHFYASEAATPIPTAAPQTGLATTNDLITYQTVGIIAIIIAITIVGVLILRKRP
jgi:hypothetical protein